MKMHYLCLSLAVAIGICLPASQLKATDVVGSDEVLEVVSEPAAVEGSQTEQAVEVNEEPAEVNEEPAASDETLEVPEVNEDIIANESHTPEIEEATGDQATETLPVEERFPSIMIAVFEAADDALSPEVADVDTEDTIDAAGEATSLEPDEVLSEDGFYVAVEPTLADATPNEEAIESEAVDEFGEDVCEEVISDAVEEAIPDEESVLAEIAESDIAEEPVSLAAEDVLSEEATGDLADEAINEFDDVAEAPNGDEVDLEALSDEQTEADQSENVDEREAVEDCIEEELDVETYLDRPADELADVDADVDAEETLEVAEEEVEVAEAVEDGCEEEIGDETYFDWLTDEFTDGDTEETIEIAEKEMEAAEAEENAGESTPTETPDDADTATVRTIEMDGCTVTIQSDNQLDDYQLLDALWDAVYQFETEMD